MFHEKVFPTDIKLESWIIWWRVLKRTRTVILRMFYTPPEILHKSFTLDFFNQAVKLGQTPVTVTGLHQKSSSLPPCTLAHSQWQRGCCCVSSLGLRMTRRGRQVKFQVNSGSQNSAVCVHTYQSQAVLDNFKEFCFCVRKDNGAKTQVWRKMRCLQ